MKGSSTLVASVIAASTVAMSSSSSESDSSALRYPFYNNQGSGALKGKNGDVKFAPRFDGLRFIETLVTAHR
ncbi:hypothetical protein K2173_021491 [Erythroxylum novogranatense]|uniref:Uncharacterized protein n=1 Tax=Erythroxylum novogranatense TaxID=1862640 RepID=A0AAV8TQ52_9ROSI|nr:hypothetical protein K2173_021491 [Erythroxylum novogranatense]